MGFRVRKSFKVAPGVRVNVSKSRVSTTLGGKGATYNAGIGRKRRRQASEAGDSQGGRAVSWIAYLIAAGVAGWFLIG